MKQLNKRGVKEHYKYRYFHKSLLDRSMNAIFEADDDHLESASLHVNRTQDTESSLRQSTNLTKVNWKKGHLHTLSVNDQKFPNVKVVSTRLVLFYFKFLNHK